ncbi:beta-ketoacyl-ACP synthase II [Flavobacterium selenitireducens]|uniref:beta-ketoacyl-ACP synthase II n=1 Tax=Flavobacterium selenitireducens TaxID=2722704 RepID=UPI00168AD582|nr:beta-ketoacyl-ACP synthase II [Flavobacterium selenitireducens]MBD3581338.1 beta-ketoacyl-ACP synthase II [Flavobacterium selenitireducens]
MKRVVITGLGAITPLGNSVAEFWQNIIKGKSGAGPITKFDASLFKTRFAHEVRNFDAERYFERKEIRKYDLFTQYAVAASDEALADSGLDLGALTDAQRAEIGVIWASGNGGISTFEQQLEEFYEGDGTPRFNPFFIPKMIVDIAAGVISIRHRFYGPNYATVSACASSNTAIISAFDTIRMGKAEIMVTGGSEAAITKSSIGGFGASQALSKNNENPEKASRPFDRDRDGFVAGEGAGALVLEELEHAKARGAKIYAEIAGGGMAADAYHLTGTPADGHGARLGMEKALKDAGIAANKIGSVNAHATSTPQGDLSELNAVQSVFGDHPVLITATKSMTGHLLGAAGAIESIISALSVNTGIVPATINLENLDANAPQGLQIVTGNSVKTSQEFVMNNTFGFGGHTATTIFRKFSDTSD